jgi:hypothetical protein
MDERIDLSALKLDEGRRELLVAAIMANAAPALARRAAAAEVSPLHMLTAWMRPAMAAAAVIAVVCVSVLALEQVETDAPVYGLADALAVPEPVDAWLVSERGPTVGDVLIAMEREGSRW